MSFLKRRCKQKPPGSGYSKTQGNRERTEKVGEKPEHIIPAAGPL